MNHKIDLRALLANGEGKSQSSLALFAWLNLGIVESLTNGVLAPADAVRIFFNADNCQFVLQELTEETANEIMSRGVQLADIFEAVPSDKANQEFQNELATIRSLSLDILQNERIAA
jgi:hypothetical protein